MSGAYAQAAEAVCPHCGAAVCAEDNCCWHCGERLPKGKSWCPECGRRFTGGEQNCPNCGTATLPGALSSVTSLPVESVNSMISPPDCEPETSVTSLQAVNVNAETVAISTDNSIADIRVVDL